MGKKFNFLIAGAGLAGLTAARILADKGYKCLVVEKRSHIAGNCYDVKNKYGITIHPYGPHIFYTSDKEVWEFVNRFSKFSIYQHKVLSFVYGNYYSFPINNKTINQVFNKNLSPGEETKKFLEDQAESANIKEINTYADAMVSQVGHYLFDMFFRGYTKKQWEKDPEELLPSLASRLPIRYNSDDRYFHDQYQGMPVNGFSAMFDNMIEHENISIMLNTDFFDVKDFIPHDNLIYTGPIDKFFNYSEGKLEYRSLKFDFITYDQEQYLPSAVVNYPNDYDFTRLTEFKQLTQEKSPKTTVCYEYPSSTGDPYYPIPSTENIARHKKYISLSEEVAKKNNIYFVGRLAQYQYFNMSQTIRASIDLANKILKVE